MSHLVPKLVRINEKQLIAHKQEILKQTGNESFGPVYVV